MGKSLYEYDEYVVIGVIDTCTIHLGGSYGAEISASFFL